MDAIKEKQKLLQEKINRCMQLKDVAEEQQRQQATEINRLRQEMIKQVDKHYDGLIQQTEEIKNGVINTIESQKSKLESVEKQIDKEVQFYADKALKEDDFGKACEMAKTLDLKIQEDLTEIQASLPAIGDNLLASVKIHEGAKWEPQHPARIEYVRLPLVSLIHNNRPTYFQDTIQV